LSPFAVGDLYSNVKKSKLKNGCINRASVASFYTSMSPLLKLLHLTMAISTIFFLLFYPFGIDE